MQLKKKTAFSIMRPLAKIRSELEQHMADQNGKVVKCQEKIQAIEEEKSWQKEEKEW